MWESRRDFQEEWEGWGAGILAFHALHSSAFSNARLSRRFTCKAGIADEKRVCEDSSRLVREKTRARLLQSSCFHHLCRFILGK
jgi:hypothetical protein